MGQEVSLPVLISPTGVQAVHPDGEVAVARAAAAAGTAMGLSSFASKPVEEVGKAIDKLLFQSYWVGSREDILARAERARAAGAKGLIVTLDWVFDSRRDWGSPWIPEKLDLKAMLRYAPQVAIKPEYLARWIRSGALPDLGVPNLGARDAQIPTFFGAYGQWMGSAPPTWEDLAWLREQWGGPFMIKGITRPDDARRAVDVGRHRDLGVQPRRQQPRLHPGHHPLPARRGRRGRRPDRGAAGRGHPAGQRRGQGPRPGRARGDDRPGLPVGHGRRGRARGDQRDRDPAPGASARRCWAWARPPSTTCHPTT